MKSAVIRDTVKKKAIANGKGNGRRLDIQFIHKRSDIGFIHKRLYTKFIHKHLIRAESILISAVILLVPFYVTRMPILYISIPRWQDKIGFGRVIGERAIQRCILVRRNAVSDLNADPTRAPLRCCTSRWQSNTVQRCIRMRGMKREYAGRQFVLPVPRGAGSRFFDCDLFAHVGPLIRDVSRGHVDGSWNTSAWNMDVGRKLSTKDVRPFRFKYSFTRENNPWIIDKINNGSFWHGRIAFAEIYFLMSPIKYLKKIYVKVIRNIFT